MCRVAQDLNPGSFNREFKVLSSATLRNCTTAPLLSHYCATIAPLLRHYCTITPPLQYCVTAPLRHRVTASRPHCVTASLRHCVTAQLRHRTTYNLALAPLGVVSYVSLSPDANDPHIHTHQACVNMCRFEINMPLSTTADIEHKSSSISDATRPVLDRATV